MASTIKISILANARVAIAGLKDTGDAAEKMGTKVSGGVGKLAGLAAGAVGVGTVVSMFAEGASEAQKFQDAANQTAEALKTNANLHGVTVDAIQKQSAQLEGLTGAKIDENDATLAQNKLIRAGVTSQAGLQAALKATSDVALGSGKDLDSVSTAVSKALANPAKAQGVLAKAGVILTQSQQDSINAMVKSGDAAGAQAAVIAALESKYKGASEAAGTGFSADLGRAKDALSDAERDIVTGLLPTVSKLAVMFADNLPKAIAAATPVVKGIFTVLQNPVFQVLAGSILAVVAGMKIYAAYVAVVSTLTKVWAGVQAALNVIMALNPVGLIIIGIVALIAVIVLVATKTRFFQTVWGAVWGWVKDTAAAVWGWLKNVFSSGVDYLVHVWDYLTSIPGRLLDIGKNIMRGLSDGISAGLQWIKDKVTGLGSSIPGWLKSTLGIHSPSRVMRGLGANIMQGLGDGISGQLPALKRQLSNVSATLTNGLSASPSVNLSTLGRQTVAGTASGTGNTYAISVNVPVGADPAEAGRQTVKAIQAFERQSGRRVLAATL